MNKRADKLILSAILTTLLMFKFPVFMQSVSVSDNFIAFFSMMGLSIVMCFMYDFVVKVFDSAHFFNVLFQWASLSFVFMLVFIPVNSELSFIFKMMATFSMIVALPVIAIIRRMKKTVLQYPDAIYFYAQQIRQYHYNAFFIYPSMIYLIYENVTGLLQDVSLYVLISSIAILLLSITARVNFNLDKDMLASVAMVAIFFYPFLNERTEFYWLILAGITFELIRTTIKLCIYMISPKRFFIMNRFPKSARIDSYRSYLRLFKGINFMNSFLTYDLKLKKISSVFVNDFYFIMKESDNGMKDCYHVFNFKNINIQRKNYLKFKYFSKKDVVNITDNECKYISKFKDIVAYIDLTSKSYSELTDDDFILMDMIEY